MIIQIPSVNVDPLDLSKHPNVCRAIWASWFAIGQRSFTEFQVDKVYPQNIFNGIENLKFTYKWKTFVLGFLIIINSLMFGIFRDRLLLGLVFFIFFTFCNIFLTSECQKIQQLIKRNTLYYHYSLHLAAQSAFMCGVNMGVHVSNMYYKDNSQFVGMSEQNKEDLSEFLLFNFNPLSSFVSNTLKNPTLPTDDFNKFRTPAFYEGSLTLMYLASSPPLILPIADSVPQNKPLPKFI